MNNQTSLFSAGEKTTAAGNGSAQTAAAKQANPKRSIKKHERNEPVQPNTQTDDRTPAGIGEARPASMPMLFSTLTENLKEFFSKRNYKRAVLGVSGGVDSALTLVLAAETLGSQNITALIMPELGVSAQENIDHAKALCEFLGIQYFVQPINSFVSDFSIVPWEPAALAKMNTKARIRAVLLYSFANTEKALVLGTSNKTELSLGYGTKYGDLAADVYVIGGLLKTEVLKLAKYAGIPQEIINKTPTAELAPGQTDEDDFGASYQDIDNVLLRRSMGEQECIAHGLPIAAVQTVFRRMKENAHKLATPETISIIKNEKQQLD